MKRLLFFLSLLAVLFPTAVSAHVLKTSGSIGAILHVEPNDDPIVGKQSSFFFEIKDKENKFVPKECDCAFQISQDGVNLYSQSLFQSANPKLSDAVAFYTFPEKGVYSISLVGKPKVPNTFKPFTLLYDLRVSKVSEDSQMIKWFSSNLLYIVGTIVGIAFVLYILYKKILPKETRNEKDSSISN